MVILFLIFKELHTIFHSDHTILFIFKLIYLFIFGGIKVWTQGPVLAR
jgi:hypothetical protein